MKKVLVLTNAFLVGGTEVALNSLLAQLAPDKYDITICCITKTGPLVKNIPGYIRIHEAEFTKPMYRMFVSGFKEKTDSLKVLFYKVKKKYYYKRYRQYGAKNFLYERLLNEITGLKTEYDLLLDFYGYGYFLTAFGAKKIYAKKKVTWIHDESVCWLDRVTEYLPYYDRIFCVSKAVRSAVIEAYPQFKQKTEVFHNLTDIERIRQRGQEKLTDSEYKGSNKILTIGRLEEQKGIDIAIQTAGMLKENNIDFSWYVIGEGNLHRKLSYRIKKMGLEENFVLLGRRENPIPYLRECMLYVQPSRHEGYATTVLEAKVLCKPIVASDIPSNREQIIDGKNGYLCFLAAECFAKQIQQLLEQKEKRNNVIFNLKNEQIDFLGEIERLEKL